MTRAASSFPSTLRSQKSVDKNPSGKNSPVNKTGDTNLKWYYFVHQPFVRMHNISFVHSSIHPVIYSSIHPVMLLCNYAFMHLSLHPFINSSVHAGMQWYIHPSKTRKTMNQSPSISHNHFTYQKYLPRNTHAEKPVS